jgi:hypothetical protein
MLTQKDKIQILLQEYSTLRSELVSNGNRLFQVVALGGALFTWLASRQLDKRFWIAIVMALVGFSCIGFVLIRDTKRAARRVRELEIDINSRAGEELLVWERRWGAAVTGFVFQKPPLPSDFDKKSLNSHSTS